VSLREVSEAEAAPLVACVVAMGEAQDRLRASYPPPPQNLRGPSRIQPDPSKRRNNPQRAYGLKRAELREWRWLMTRKRYTAIEAANIVIRSRRAK
jgi:hypothetical protein